MFRTSTPLIALICVVPLDASAQSLLFTEVSEEAGIVAGYALIDNGFRDMSFMYAGGAVGDFNRDGWPDIFVLTGDHDPDRLYINNQDGTFTDEAAAWGVDRLHVGGGATVGDYNGDGWPDMYITSMGRANDDRSLAQHLLYRNNGDGTFSEVGVEAGVNNIGAVLPDGYSSAFGDYDLDGDLDLMVAMWHVDNHGLTLFRNEGNGTFTRRNEAIQLDTTHIYGFTPGFADMNNDGWPDIVLTGDFQTSAFYVNNKNGSFDRRTRAQSGFVDTNGMGMVVAELTGDDRLDWFVSNISITESGPDEGQNLFKNLGNNIYEDVAPAVGCERAHWAWGADACDLNNDGAMELIVANGWYYNGAMPNCLFINNGDNTWNEIGEDCGFDHTGLARGLASLDYDMDGDLDLAVFNHSGPFLLYRNELSGTDTFQLSVRLDTTHRPDLAPNGVGASVEFINEGKHQMRYVDGAPTYLAVSDLAEHFGMGADNEADLIRITWPDGVVEEYAGYKAGHVYTFEAPPSCRYPDSDGDGVPDFGDFDATSNDIVDMEDLYAVSTGAHDINEDGLVDISDARCLTAFLRSSERADLFAASR